MFKTGKTIKEYLITFISGFVIGTFFILFIMSLDLVWGSHLVPVGTSIPTLYDYRMNILSNGIIIALGFFIQAFHCQHIPEVLDE